MMLVVGRIGRPHGLRGEVSVVVRTDSPDQRFAVGAEFVLGAGRRVTVAGTRWHKGMLLVQLDGVADRNAAEELRGEQLTVAADQLPDFEDPDEFHDHQLVGLRAELADGQVVGTVRDVVHGPAGELLILARDDQDEALVPFVRDIVPTIDIPGGRLILTPPEGLLD
ncbi:ribosome maturation factor RimM [Pseudonocardia spinosispora]|uniref:ribosome maturation factor RimM n=1 Tax=Pseudonocardia spinosispora TaxID=103441 RepID=UPI00048CD59F|nr:ribosome maturation factor RimM [Pseudonocardia spinosispora]